MTEYIIKKILAEQIFGNRLCESVIQQNRVNFMYKHLMLEALVGEPISIDELRDLLSKKIVNFEFIKLNGDIRPAKGTTNLRHVPGIDHPKGTGHSSPTVATFYDLKKQLWRSVSQRSKEIVLKQDDTEGKTPIVTVTDKNKNLVNKLDRFKAGKTYEYINRFGESGHTVTVMQVVEKGYYLKLDKTGPLFYLTIDTANKRIKNEIKKPREVIQPIVPLSNKAVSKVKQLINSPTPLPMEKKPLDTRDQTKKAYDIKDNEIVAPDNVLKPTVTPPQTIPPKISEPEEEKIMPPTIEEEPMKETPYDKDKKDEKIK